MTAHTYLTAPDGHLGSEVRAHFPQTVSLFVEMTPQGNPAGPITVNPGEERAFVLGALFAAASANVASEAILHPEWGSDQQRSEAWKLVFDAIADERNQRRRDSNVLESATS